MRKTKGKIHDDVAQRLKAKGYDTSALEVATLSRGTDHLVILNGETVGEYNHISKKLVLYKTETERRMLSILIEAERRNSLEEIKLGLKEAARCREEIKAKRAQKAAQKTDQ